MWLKRVRLVVGVLLIFCAILGLIFWEKEGREAVTSEQVLVAAETIEKGTKMKADLFQTIGIPEKNKIIKSLKPGEEMSVNGKIVTQTILKNAQISPVYFEDDQFRLKDGESIYVIPAKWIFMRSSALRRGDRIAVYSRDGSQALGHFLIAFAKDEAEREVMDAGDKKKLALLARTDSTAQISHIEIISDLQGYEILRQAAEQGGVEGEEPIPSLLIVHE